MSLSAFPSCPMSMVGWWMPLWPGQQHMRSRLPLESSTKRDRPPWHRRNIFYSLARTHSVLSYWFRLDTSQIAFNPQPIVFPTHSASEWAAVGSYIGKLVSRYLREKATTVVTFLENLKLELMEMQQYLGMKNGATSWEQVACRWILSNRLRWEKWILLAAGSFVSSRNVATGCGLCTPGSQSLPLSDEIGRTYRCDFCDLGSYQESSGETLCISCPLGRIAAERGRSQCEACPPGSYADAFGLHACSPCGSSCTGTDFTLS